MIRGAVQPTSSRSHVWTSAHNCLPTRKAPSWERLGGNSLPHLQEGGSKKQARCVAAVSFVELGCCHPICNVEAARGAIQSTFGWPRLQAHWGRVHRGVNPNRCRLLACPAKRICLLSACCLPVSAGSQRQGVEDAAASAGPLHHMAPTATPRLLTSAPPASKEVNARCPAQPLAPADSLGEVLGNNTSAYSNGNPWAQVANAPH